MPLSHQNSAPKPLVSIAMATYNGERYLEEQLESLLAQDYPNLEIIISDDGSSDRSIDILKQYEKKTPHITVLENPVNLGYIKNFENAIKHTNGDFVALCDQDDVWADNKISQQLAALETNRASGVYTNAHLVDSKNRVIEGIDLWSAVNKRLPIELLPPEAFYLSNCVTGCTFLMRRDIATGAMPFPDGVPHDWWLAYHCAFNDGIYGLNQHLVRYRQHGGNVLGLPNVLKKKRFEFYIRDRIQKMTIDAQVNKNLKAERESIKRLTAMETFENETNNLENILLTRLKQWAIDWLDEKPIAQYSDVLTGNDAVFTLADKPPELPPALCHKTRIWRFRKRVFRRYAVLGVIVLSLFWLIRHLIG